MAQIGKIKSATEVLEGALEAINEFGWIKQAYGNAAQGFCLVGAVEFAAAGDFNIGYKVRDILWDSISRKDQDYVSSIISYNDRPERTKRQIIALLKRAIKKSKSTP